MDDDHAGRSPGTSTPGRWGPRNRRMAGQPRRTTNGPPGNSIRNASRPKGPSPARYTRPPCRSRVRIRWRPSARPRGVPRREPDRLSRPNRTIPARIVDGRFEASGQPHRVAERAQHERRSRRTEVEAEQQAACGRARDVLGAAHHDVAAQGVDVRDAEHRFFGDEATVVGEQPDRQRPLRPTRALSAGPRQRLAQPADADDAVADGQSDEHLLRDGRRKPPQGRHQRTQTFRPPEHAGHDRSASGNSSGALVPSRVCAAQSTAWI